eukprot:c21896_g1_i2 orf=191-1471(-)
MDEIFEQMLSASSWGDGVGGMAMDSLALQSLSKMGSVMPSAAHLIGAMENQGLSSQEHQDTLFNTHQDHLQLSNARGLSRRSPMENSGLEGPSYQQSSQLPSLIGGPWREPFMGSVPPLPLNQGKPGPFPPSGDGMSNDLHLGKRIRGDEDTMKTSMSHGAQPQADGDPAHFGQSAGGAATNGSARPRVRARRGQATDPHSIAERNRRERIAERMKALQELVPDSNKTDKASMLDEIIGYVKFLQMQVKCLSMCRLGGAGAAAPLLADLPAEGAANFIAANLAQANGSAGASQDGIAFAERQVARLMDEDMSAAMQYLQSKGLCLMPISLATAISSTGTRQQATPSKSSEANGSEKQTMGLQSLVANGAANSATMTSLGSNDMDMKHMSKISKEIFQDEAVNDKVGHGLPPASSKGGSKIKDDDQR